MSEEELKAKFEETFGTAYIKYLRQKDPTKQDLAELLYVGFCHGYVKGKKDAEMCEM